MGFELLRYGYASAMMLLGFLGCLALGVAQYVVIRRWRLAWATEVAAPSRGSASACSRARRARRARPRGAGPIREPAHEPQALVGEQHRGARVADRLQRAGERLDRGGPARRRLVEEQDARLGHQPAGDHQHLLLAAGERARELLRPVREPREERVGALAPRGDGARSRRIAVGAEREVLVHGQAPRTRAARRGRSSRRARAIRSGGAPAISWPASVIEPERGRSSPAIACTAAVRPVSCPASATISPAPTVQREPGRDEVADDERHR